MHLFATACALDLQVPFLSHVPHVQILPICIVDIPTEEEAKHVDCTILFKMSQFLF